VSKPLGGAARLPGEPSHPKGKSVLEPLHGDPSGDVVRRLIDQVARMIPPSGQGDLQARLFEVKERFVILRRIAVESAYLAHQGRRVDSSLLLEIGALTTNRLIALLQALPDGRMTRQDFIDQMDSEVGAYRESDLTLGVRMKALQSLAVAQIQIDRLERSIQVAAEVDLDFARHCALACAVSIALFLEAWWLRPEEGQHV